MGFREVKRYHVGCDKPGCENLFFTIDLSDDIEDEEGNSYPWELEYPIYSDALIDVLVENEWIFDSGKLYCPPCSAYVSHANEESLFAFLKADMGIT